MSAIQPTPENVFGDDYSKLSRKELFEMMKVEQESERAGMDEFYSDPSNFVPAIATTAITQAIENDDPFSAPDKIGPHEGALIMAELGVPVAPVAANAKYPPIAGFPKLATTDKAQIDTWAQERPNCNWLALARPEGVCFIDKDDVAKLHALYQEKYGEAWPRSLRTRSQNNHEQEWWKQTDRTRAFENQAQSSFKDRMLSFRQDGQYCLVAGSHLEPSSENGPVARDYELVDASVIAVMPDRLMDFIESLLVAKAKKSHTRKREPEMYINGRPVEAAPPDPGFKKLFDALGWKPLQDRLNKHVDTRFHDFTVGEHEANTYCPIPSHGPQDVNVNYRPCFGVVPSEPGLLHCFGCDWTGDVVAACYEVDGDDKRNMYDVGRAICVENDLKFDDYFLPSNTPAANPTATAAAAAAAPTAPEWGEPEAFDGSLLPVKNFELDFLPTCMQGWAKDVAYRTSVPLGFVGICALVCLAGVVNRRAFVYPKQNDKEWKEALSVSGAVVAPSGKLKTPTWKAFTNTLIEQEYDWRAAYSKVAEAYDLAHEQWERVHKENEKIAEEIKRGKKGRELAVETDEPVEPVPCRRLIVNDATPEMLHSVMSYTPEGVLVYRDELSSWVAELDKEGREVSRGLYLAAMNGNDHYTMDRIGRGSVTAIMSASLFGGFQPDLLVDFLNNARNVADGTIPRFGLLVWPDDNPISSIVDQGADEGAKHRFKSVSRRLAELPAETIRMHFDAQAQPIFIAWLGELDKKIDGETHNGKRSHLSKYKGLLPKLAGLLQIADTMWLLGKLEGNHLIDLKHLSRAIRLVAYLESHMHRVYGCIKSLGQKAEEGLARHLKAGDLEDGFTIREIINRKHWEFLTDSQVVDSALETMEEMNWVRELPAEKRRGKPTRRWEINPAIKKNIDTSRVSGYATVAE